MIQTSVTWFSVITNKNGILSYTASTLAKRIRMEGQVERVEGNCIFYVNSEVLTVLLLNIQAFWYVTP
jgi:hypothetical protein